jgi:hypothetical protein
LSCEGKRPSLRVTRHCRNTIGQGEFQFRKPLDLIFVDGDLNAALSSRLQFGWHIRLHGYDVNSSCDPAINECKKKRHNTKWALNVSHEDSSHQLFKYGPLTRVLIRARPSVANKEMWIQKKISPKADFLSIRSE